MFRSARRPLSLVASGAFLGLLGVASPRASPSAVESGTWSPLSVAGVPPSPRRDFSVAQAGQSMVVFGGYDGQPLNDLYRLVLGPSPGWERFPYVFGTPASRWGHRAIYDSPRNRQVIFGGYGYAEYLDDPWEFLIAINDWNFLSYRSLVPRARTYYGMVYDPIRQRALVIGGFTR